MGDLDKLRTERDMLVQRLEVGYAKCEAARGTPEYDRFEDHWIGLLRTYESIQTRIDRGERSART